MVHVRVHGFSESTGATYGADFESVEASLDEAVLAVVTMVDGQDEKDRSSLRTAKMACETLNDLLKTDKQSIQALFSTRVFCNSDLADHPTCQVGKFDGRNAVGVLAIINAIFVNNPNMGSLIGCEIDDVSGEIYKFEVMSERRKRRKAERESLSQEVNRGKVEE